MRVGSYLSEQCNNKRVITTQDHHGLSTMFIKTMYVNEPAVGGILLYFATMSPHLVTKRSVYTFTATANDANRSGKTISTFHFECFQTNNATLRSALHNKKAHRVQTELL